MGKPPGKRASLAVLFMSRHPILSSILTATIGLFLVLFVVLTPEYLSIAQVGLECNNPVFASTWGDYRCALPCPAS